VYAARPNMDVTLLKSSLYELPSTLRVGAIVHDGAADLQLFPGPGPDKDLTTAFGPDLQKALDTEIRLVPGKVLPQLGCIRIARGRLHCDFLLWVATRPAETETERAPAPDAETIRMSVIRALEFVAQRSVERVAFMAMGGGPGELDRVERLAEMAKGAHAYHDACVREGKSPVVEEVVLCEADARTYAAASTRLKGSARSAAPPTKTAEREARKVASGKGSRKQKALPEDEVIKRRTSSAPFSMKKTYGSGEWLLHPRFGVGRVEAVLAEGAIMVLFEDGENRKMAHSRV
jgi:hypothetical protein